MLSISSVLGGLILDYHKHLRSSGRDSRIVVPGLTPTISREIQEYLLSRGVTAYLVISDDLNPDKDRLWIRPMGLTSRRIGSFVAIACPGQLAHIQDSIRGSGGAIRSVAFSEEWPWIDNGSESFQFNGPVLRALVTQWTTSQEEQQWLCQFIRDCLLASTRSYSRRANLLLEDLLGTFSPSLYPELSDVRLKMLFHSGVPCPEGPIPSVPRLIRNTRRLCEKIVEKCRREDGTRQQALSLVPDVIPPAEAEVAGEALNALIDGVGQSRTLDLGPLAFFSCWGGEPRYWSVLSASRLERLFEVEDRERASLEYEVICGRAIISSRRNALATFHGEEVILTGTYRLPADQIPGHSWAVALYYRGRALQSETLGSAEGEFRWPIDTSMFSQYGGALVLRLVLLQDREAQTEARIKMHLCGPDRPAFAVLEPGFEVFDATALGGEETPDKKVEGNEPADLYMVSCSGEAPMLLDEDENVLPIEATGCDGIWRAASKVDPSEHASGQVTRICRFGPLLSVVCLEAKDIEKGEFTLEDELRVRAAGIREGSVDEVLAVFSGESRELHQRLGGMNVPARRRSLIASAFTSSMGWRPLLVDLLKDDYDEAGLIGDYVAFRGAIQAPAFRRLTLPARALKLLQEYASARSALLELIQSSISVSDRSSEHPLYATHPVYVDSRAEVTEQLLVRYLQAYRGILDYLQDSCSVLEWAQMFVLTYLDCVVHWDDSVLRNSLLLAGPWHPLVLSKRYMVQSALFNRAKHIEDKVGKEFRRLTALLKETTGFRWLAGLHRDDRLLELLCVTPTSDPAWHLAIKPSVPSIAAQSSAGSLVGILRRLEEHLGLQSPMLLGCTEDFVRAALASFVRAFPGRRALGVRVGGGYYASRVMSSIGRFLYDEDRPSDFGRQLPGGVHVFTDATPKEFEETGPEGLPVMVYRCDKGMDCLRDAMPDVYLVSPVSEVSFRRGHEKYCLPRGEGRHSVFSEPLSWLTEGQALLPVSVTMEFDEQPVEPNDLGGAFVDVTARLCQVIPERMVTLHSVDLPLRLDCPWAVVPGGQVDPAILVKYVRDGCTRSLQERALWDYRVDVAGSKNTYYVLSTIPKSFEVAVNGFFGRDGAASEFVQDLGALGIAIGGEALKTGRHALGVVGLVGTIRLLNGTGGSGKGAFKNDAQHVGFLLPVDPFVSFFGAKGEIDPDTREDVKRADLLAVQLALPRDDNPALLIRACGVESKYVSHALSHGRAIDALSQAKASLERFRLLVQTAREDWAVPERLGLLAMIKFGLRTIVPRMQQGIGTWVETERTVMESILRGRFEFGASLHDALVVSTEGQLPGAPECRVLPGGLWIRINRGHWPGIADTRELETIREELTHLFDIAGRVPSAREGGIQAIVASRGGGPCPEPSSSQSAKGAQVNANDRREPTGDRNDNRITVSNEPGRPRADSAAADEGPLKRVILGVDDARRPVFYDPQSLLDPLDNLNVMITGSSGTGKTQLVKYLICKIREQGKNVLVIDFKNDFANDRAFARVADLESVFVNFSGLPFNPLIPYPIRHPHSGELVVQTGQHISGVSAVLRRAYGLGPQQEIAVKNAIVESFNEFHIPTTGTMAFGTLREFPDFGMVGRALLRTDRRAYNRLDPLFTLELFRPEYQGRSFHHLVNRSLILDLSMIPSDAIKNALAELLVMSAHAYYNSQTHSGVVRQVLVFDEAHRVLQSDFMASLVRECRAYGVGVVLSSQYPDDFPPEISSSMATKVLHSNGRDVERVKSIVQAIGCIGKEAEVSSLDRFQAFFDNRHHPCTLISTMIYPLYILYSHLLRHGEASPETLANLDGIDSRKLPIGYLLRLLERLGLIAEAEGRVRLLRRYE